MRAVAFIAALVVGNFVYQAITGRHDYAVAIERSWFQGWALGSYAVFTWGWR